MNEKIHTQLLLEERAEEPQQKPKLTHPEGTENLAGDRKRSPQIGDKFGMLRVVEVNQLGVKKCRVKCQCECGETRIFPSSELYGKNPKYAACNINGCRQVNEKHGFASMRNGPQLSEYNIWKSMNQRCYDKKGRHFRIWGGRGIRVCDEWRHDFTAFFRDMGRRPSKKHSIDRIDNSKGYCKENCRWATPIEQCNNKRNNVLLTFNGITLTIGEWARKTGVCDSRIRLRIRRGWETKDAITKPHAYGL